MEEGKIILSRTKKFFYNSLSVASLQLVTMLAGFTIPRFMLQYYGSEVNGLITSITQFIAYFNLVEAGLAGAAIYALYKPLADNDYKAINGIVSAARYFYRKAGYILIFLILGLSIIYPIFIESNKLSPISVGLLVLILGVNGVLDFFILSKYRVLLTADQKTYIISFTTIVHILLNTIIIVVASVLRIDIVILRFIALLSIFFKSLILLIYVKQKYKYLNYKVEPNNNALNKRWDALYLQILGVVQSGFPVILATIFTSLPMVSVYSIYNMVIGGVNGILSIFISGLSASFGDVIARGERKILQKSYNEFELIYYNLITITYAIAFIMIMPFIKIYTNGVDDINYNLPFLGFLFVLNGWLYNIKTPQGMLVISAGMYKETRIQSTIQAAIIIVVGILLAPKYGLVGIMVASCLSNLYRDIDLFVFIPKNVTELPVRTTLYRILRMIMGVLIICLPFYYIDIPIANFVEWFIKALAVGLYSIVVVGIISIIFDRVVLKNVFHRIILIFTRSKNDIGI